MATDVEKLNEQFAIAGVALVVAGHGGLPKVQIASPAVSAEIYLHGAQIVAWKPTGGSEVIFTSEQSHWVDGKAIRGGIPVCFPWFRGKADDPKAPAHGLVRTKSWMVKSLAQENGSICVTLTTESDEETRLWWPHDFRLILRIKTGSHLDLELTVENTGSTSFQFEEALHTYYRVGDVRKVGVSGLSGVAFLANQDGNREKVQTGDLVMTGPTDNAYMNTANPLMITDSVLRRRIQIEKQNSNTTVAWNPWEAGAKALADLGDDEWQRMICVEASNILSSAVTLAPGEEHRMATTLTVIEDGVGEQPS